VIKMQKKRRTGGRASRTEGKVQQRKVEGESNTSSLYITKNRAGLTVRLIGNSNEKRARGLSSLRGTIVCELGGR